MIADHYRTYHKHLDSFDKGVFVKFLPKRQQDLAIVDLGAGDGRLYKYLAPLHTKKYVACDIAEQLLKKHPGKCVEKLVCNLEDSLPLYNDSFDLATSFFVLEHIKNIDNLFSEVYRILKSSWVWIIGHFIQRREFIWKKDKDQFKIQFFNHRISDLEKLAKKNFFTSYVLPIYEKRYTLGHIIVCKKM